MNGQDSKISKDTRIKHPVTGSEEFGHVTITDKNSKVLFGDAPIYLEKGDQRYGADHIWKRRNPEIVKMTDQEGALAAADFVADIMTHAMNLFTENDGKAIAVNGIKGTVIVQPKYERDGTTVRHYNIVTAFGRTTPNGYQIGKVKV